MTGWELHDGKAQIGPLDEEHILRMIGTGLPAETLVRGVGQSSWESLRAHAPFAMAIDRRAGPSPQPGAPPAPATAATTPNVFTHPYVIGGVAIAALAILFAAAASSSPPRSNAALPPTPAPTVQAQVAPQKPAAAKPVDGAVKGSNGGWAKIPRPGEDVADTAEARVTYMTSVLTAAPGEPKLDKKAAAALLDKLRAAMAKQGTVSVAAIKPSVGDASGSLVVAAGVMAGLSVRGEPRYYPVCSEAILATGIIEAGLEPGDFAKAGLRGVMCKSDGCSAVFDMRPTSSGGGMYGGDSCLSFEAMLKEATQP